MPSMSSTASTILSLVFAGDGVDGDVANDVDRLPTLTISIAPMSPPARPIAVVTSPSVPARVESLTRRVRL